jgi:hypothetical protein
VSESDGAVTSTDTVAKKSFDAQDHGMTCEVAAVHTDDLGAETGCSTDAHSYTLRGIKTGNKLSIPFRHYDLVLLETMSNWDWFRV